MIVVGISAFGFNLPLWHAAACIGGALATQYIADKAIGRDFDVRSPMISALSLTLLLRTGSIWLSLAAGALALASKYLIRYRGKHIFNPANFGLVVLALLFAGAWVSPGQWGAVSWLAIMLICLGGIVTGKAKRWGVSLAFLGFHALFVTSRALWLGDPLSIPLHQLQSGALLIFTFFMISDPKTTPNARRARVGYAALVAFIGFSLQSQFYQSAGPIYALILCAPLVPIFDHLLKPGSINGRSVINPRQHTKELRMLNFRKFKPNLIRKALSSTAIVSVLSFGLPAAAFCGFYVAKADTGLFNESSKVVLVRDGDSTVITMANGYQGDPTEFAMVIPVPTVITKEQVHISNAALLDHLDAYTAPRLVEYFDSDPCDQHRLEDRMFKSMSGAPQAVMEMREEAEVLGVTIEESFSVGEYDILILSAKESDGLKKWLTANGYKIPKGADKVLKSYIKQDMKFFVAKINLEEKAKIGGEMLRPIAVAFESPKFMLPIRLGTVNSKGSQDLFVYALTKNGRVETTNYRTQKVTSDKEVPVFVKDKFGEFYTSMYEEATRKEGGKGVFMEYAWDMGWCDPCAADPLSREQLQELGVFWLDGPTGNLVRSDVDVGTIFRMSVIADPSTQLSRWECQAKDDQFLSAQARNLSSLRCLISEDNPVNMEVLKLLLEPYSLSLVETTNGQEVIQALDNQFFDVVLMDLQMPILGGQEAVRRIRHSGKHYAQIPVIAMSASAMDDVRRACFAVGFSAFLTKPLKRNELISTIEAVANLQVCSNRAVA